MLRLAELTAESLDIELNEPFGIATGAQVSAANVLVRARLEDGTVGLGEAAPFPAVSGETQQAVLEAIANASSDLVGTSVGSWRAFAARLAELCPELPSARCAVESAALDALCRHAKLSLWSLFGGRQRAVVSDLTIVTGDAAHAAAAAARACARGFNVLKIKVGGADLAHDLARLRAIAQAVPRTKIILDANASYSVEQANELVTSARTLDLEYVLFEQPVSADDLAGARKVREVSGIPVAADESARTARDVARLVEERACDVVNIKIMKTGIAEAIDMIGAARAHGLGLMVGGMVESVLAMTVSACLAAGQGGFSFVDLDTHWFMSNVPFVGGFTIHGAELRVDELGHGHGVTVRHPAPFTDRAFSPAIVTSS